MAALSEIRDIARVSAKTYLRPGVLDDIRVAEEVGPDGAQLLRITLIVTQALDDRDFVQTLLSIKRHVRDTDTRQTFVGYATPAELADDGDTES